MSSYKILFRASHKLRSLLIEAFRADGEIEINDPTQIVPVNPTAAAQNNRARLSLWLYRVVEDGFVKNAPMPRHNGNGQRKYTPLAVDLYFLVTPIVRSNEDPDRSLLLLGKTMQVFYDHAITVIDEGGFDVAEELKISLVPMTLEELTRVWEALQEPYQLSVCYQVRVARIESERSLERTPVEHRQADFSEVPIKDADAW